MKPSSFVGDRSSGRGTHDLIYELSRRGFPTYHQQAQGLGDKREPDPDLWHRGSLEGTDAGALVERKIRPLEHDSLRHFR